VERVVVDDRTPRVTLGLTLLVGPVLVGPEGEHPADEYAVALRP
jgi:hypothetical protein